MKAASMIVISKSTFCGLMIFNGVLVAASCLVAVRPVYVERVDNLGTLEASQELSYLYGLIGLGAMISTVVALSAIPVFREFVHGTIEPPAEKTSGQSDAP